ncbi:MAG: glycosyltransferase family 8 protein [Anaerococcus sp.]|uniref:glycosyltransferase family 8 protein n=1 Tax=Anaerococcus sp. TaxID=1872515 RepID=UPI0028FF542C|nr:glycosyltransferase family 8 protein [Anaerococcus sp.]MDU2353534.1 glycosyltransferase family 8 protein [Anaerococcus sp.]
MNILVSCDTNYLNPLKTMLYSLFLTNDNYINIYILHSSISDENIKELENYIKDKSNSKARLINLKVVDEFKKAHTTFYYTSEMYFRLIAYKYLPEDLDRILYLDPDTLILNSLMDLYESDFEENYYMAAIHTIPTVQSANKARLILTSEKSDIVNYYNSGILMINLKKAREKSYDDKIINYIEHSPKAGLMMPDQDLLNVVFRKKIKEISELKFNYDARRYSTYKVKYGYELEDVMLDTAILHFCGKRKPWKGNYVGKFNSLYQFMWKQAVVKDNK